MNKNKKVKIIIIAIIFIIIAIGGIIIKLKNNSVITTEWENEFSEIDKNEINYKANATINELKDAMSLTADEDLYEIVQEYDGRKTLNIKSDILYKVAFVGIVKDSKPTFEELDEIYEKII